MPQANPPQVVDVDLIIHQPTNDGFELATTDVPVKNDRLTFENNGNDGFIVRFTIDDRTGNDYVFPSDKKKALWARKVSGAGDCPSSNCHWGQFKATSVEADGEGKNKILVVRNKNGHMQYFGYALRVGTDTNSDPTLTFDPIGDNRNGSV